MFKRKAIRILKRAQKVLEKNEWERGSLYSVDKGEPDKFCAMGAVNVASWGIPAFSLHTPAVHLAVRYLGQEAAMRKSGTQSIDEAICESLYGSSAYQEVTSYNDRHARNKDEVLSLFSDAIIRLQGENRAPLTTIDATVTQHDLDLAAGPD